MCYYRELFGFSRLLSHIQTQFVYRKVCSARYMLAAACTNGGVQLSVAEDSLRASESVEESLMNTLQRTIDSYEACVFLYICDPSL
jgi:hypothetical protein